MISLTMTINNDEIVVEHHAIRIFPTKKTPEEGELCTYELYKNKEKMDATVVCHYGDARRLGIQMLTEAMMEEGV